MFLCQENKDNLFKDFPFATGNIKLYIAENNKWTLRFSCAILKIISNQPINAAIIMEGE